MITRAQVKDRAISGGEWTVYEVGKGTVTRIASHVFGAGGTMGLIVTLESGERAVFINIPMFWTEIDE